MTPELLLVAGTFIVVLLPISLGVAIWAAHMAIKANIELVGLKNSTHQVQYVPMPDPQGQRVAGDEFGLPRHDDDGDIDRVVTRGERSAFEAAGDLDDETFAN